MAKNGEIYIEIEGGYGNLSLGCYSRQSESTTFVGSEQRSANGSLQIFNIAGKKSYSLESPVFSFAEYKKRENYIISRLGAIEKVYIDTEGGFKLMKVRITGVRKIASNGTNDEYSVNLKLEEG